MRILLHTHGFLWWLTDDARLSPAARNAFTVLPVALHHALRLHSLPSHHRDPFDRILVAQALSESMPIVTADAGLRRYGPELIW